MKLVYFNARGLAETSRFLLAIAGETYTDQRYPIEIIDWATHNIKKDEFDADRQLGLLEKSLNKLPYLDVDGEVISQSKTIERYIARRFNMMGQNEIQAAQIDAITEYVRDFKTEYQKTRSLTGEERDAGMTKWFGETLPAHLQNLDKIVGTTHSVGSSLSLADVTLYTFLTQFFDNVEGARSALNTTTNLKTVVENVESLEKVQGWLKARPTTGF